MHQVALPLQLCLEGTSRRTSQLSSKGLKPELTCSTSPLPCTGFSQPGSELAAGRGVGEGGSTADYLVR